MLVKSCDTSYTHDALNKAGIDVKELVFADGQLPPQDVMDRWLKIVDDFFDSTFFPGDGENFSSCSMTDISSPTFEFSSSTAGTS